jgi:hypothetical protein
MAGFNARLRDRLVGLDLPDLAAFHRILRRDVGVYLPHALWAVVDPANRVIGGEDAWEMYGAWLVAQGREFREAVRRDHRAALARLPGGEELYGAEWFLFAAAEEFSARTDEQPEDRFPELFP